MPRPPGVRRRAESTRACTRSSCGVSHGGDDALGQLGDPEPGRAAGELNLVLMQAQGQANTRGRSNWADRVSLSPLVRAPGRAGRCGPAAPGSRGRPRRGRGGCRAAKPRRPASDAPAGTALSGAGSPLSPPCPPGRSRSRAGPRGRRSGSRKAFSSVVLPGVAADAGEAPAPGQGVQQARLADVGPADERHFGQRRVERRTSGSGKDPTNSMGRVKGLDGRAGRGRTPCAPAVLAVRRPLARCPLTPPAWSARAR